tara:strand:- start:103 stop:1704 length:1602 start_codon:yes stop_codon:yes gene_type:complete
MKSKDSLINIVFFLITFLIYAYIFGRNNQLYLINPPDEFSFKYLIQTTNINNFDFSSPLYAFIYKIIFLFDQNFYNVAKVLNLFFYFLANLAIYLIAKKIINRNFAKIIFLISSINTYNFYSSSLMPEIFFYMYFYFFIYCYIFFKNYSIKYSISGINIFILFCIKGTGIFLLPAIIISEAILSYKNNNKFKDFIKKVTLILVSFFTLFIILKLLMLGTSNTLFGSKYENIFKEISSFEEIIYIFSLFSKNYLGQIYYNFFVYGLPFTLFFFKLFSKENKFKKIDFFPFLIVISLSLFSSLNHALYVFSYPNELDVHRFNTRYYDFILPLILISVYEFKHKNYLKNKAIEISIYSIPIFLFFLVIFTQIENFRPTFVIFDSILFRGYVYNDIFFNVFVLINILIIISYFFLNFKSTHLYIIIYVPFIIILSSIPIIKEIHTYSNPNAYDLVGNIMKNNNHFKDNKITIVGNKFKGEDYRVFFNLNYKKIKRLEINELNDFLNNNNSILLIDNDEKFSELGFISFMDGRYLYIK